MKFADVLSRALLAMTQPSLESVRGRRRRGLSAVTIENYRSELQRLEREVGPLLDDATKVAARLKVWRERAERAIRAKQLSSSTVAVAVSALRTFYAVLNEQRLYSGNPALAIPSTARKRGKPRPAKSHEIAPLFKAPDVSTPSGRRDRVMLELFLHGLRQIEVRRLMTDHIEYYEAGDERTLVVHAQGKGEKERQVPLNPAAAPLLASYLLERFAPNEWRSWQVSQHQADVRTYLLLAAKHLLEHVLEAPQWVFVTDQGRPLNKRWVNRRFVSYRTAAGVGTNLGPHNLRHRFATNLLDNGRDLREVQELLGHSDIRTTAVYTDVQTPRKLAATSALETPAAEEVPWIP